MIHKIGIIMDPIESIDPEKDTTFELALEAQLRGYEVWFILMEDLFLINGEVFCRARQVQFQREKRYYEFLSDVTTFSLDTFDIVLMRKDPPFDTLYFFATHLLSFCKKARVYNHPKSLRESPEKIYPLQFPGIFPNTLITNHSCEIRAFMKKNGGEVILKPLNSCGGEGILYLHDEDSNFESILEMSTKNGKEWIIVQQYLPEVKNGDKRIICVNGKAEGAILRIPKSGEHRANMHAGGSVTFVELNDRDVWLVEQISSQLKLDGHYFVGLDIIGDYITEINVTSPTGIQEIRKLGGIDIAKIFWDGLIK